MGVREVGGAVAGWAACGSLFCLLSAADLNYVKLNMRCNNTTSVNLCLTHLDNLPLQVGAFSNIKKCQIKHVL